MDYENIDVARSEIHAKLQKIIEQKEQKTHGVKHSAFLIECRNCHKMIKKAFLAYDPKDKSFICFECQIKKKRIL